MAEISICQFHKITVGKTEKALQDHQVSCSPALLRPPVTHVLKCYTHVAFKSFQGCGRWEFHPCPWARAGQHFLRRNSPNTQSKLPLAQGMHFEINTFCFRLLNF